MVPLVVGVGCDLHGADATTVQKHWPGNTKQLRRDTEFSLDLNIGLTLRTALACGEPLAKNRPMVPWAKSIAYDLNHMTTYSSLPPVLQALARPQPFGVGDMVFRMGGLADGVYFLKTGAVRLNRYGPGGEEVSIHHATAGEFFAEASLLTERYHCSAIATRDSVVELLPSDKLRQLLKSDPQFALQWADILSRQLRRTRANVERLCLKGAEERLRHLLLTEGRGPSGKLEIPGTAKELAAYLGLTHEALYRTISSMKKNGTLGQEGKALWLVTK